MTGKRGLGILYFGFKKPKQGDDDFDIHQLRETIKQLYKDDDFALKTIQTYEKKITQWQKYPKVVEAYKKMKLLEEENRRKSLETVEYYQEELLEELKKEWDKTHHKTESFDKFVKDNMP